MIVRYEHASEERDALLAQELNRYREGANLVPLTKHLDQSRSQRAPRPQSAR